MRFVFSMAGRALRAEAARLALLVVACGLGLAAFTVTAGFSESVRGALRREARTLLGADFTLSAPRPLPADLVDRARAVAGIERATLVTDTVTLAEAREGGTPRTRLVEIRAIEDTYPLTGELVLEPAASPRALGDRAFVEGELARAFSLRPAPEGALANDALLSSGRALKLGGRIVPIAAVVLRDSGREAGALAFGPRVYLARATAARLGLIGALTRVREKLMLAAAPEARGPERSLVIAQALRALLREANGAGARLATHLDPPANLARPIRNLNLLLEEVGLGTLALSILGAWAALAAWLRARARDVAILRTLGASPATPTLVYGVVVCGVILAAAVLGALVGLGLGALLPGYLAPLLPSALSGLRFELPSLVDLGLAALLVLALSLSPLGRLQRTAPASILRDGAGENGGRPLLVIALSTGLALGLAVLLVHRRAGSGGAAWLLAGGIGALGLLLVGASAGLVALLRRLEARLPLAARLAAGELGRPRSLAGFTMGILGAAVFVALVAEFARADLLAPLLAPDATSERPNVYFVDVQPDQRAPITELLRARAGREPITAPVVRARLATIAGRPAEGPASGSPDGRPAADEGAGLRTREQNLTYRDALADGESVVAGRFWEAGDADAAQVSLEARFAQRIGARLGDELAFDVQGVTLRARVTSLRRVTWQNLRPNFFIVAPTRLLGDAPQVSFLAAFVPEDGAREALQRDVTSRFPNVTVIDATLVARRIADVLGLVGTVTQALSLLMALSSLAVLAATLVAGRARRARGIALLRTLGAPGALLARALTFELALVGLLGGGLGALLAYGLAELSAAVLFELPSRPSALSALLAVVLATALALVVGGLATARVLRQKPMRTLGEGG